MLCSQRLKSVLVLSLVLVSSTAWADLPGNRNGGRRQPRLPVPAVKIESRVEMNDQAKLEGEVENAVAKIVIPRRILLQLLQQPGVAPGAAPGRSEAPIGGTVIAGLCLALAAVAAGYAWRRAASRRLVIASSILLAGFGLVSSGFADIPPFKQPVKPNPLIDQNPQDRPTVILVSDPEDGPVRIFLKHAAPPRS